MNPINFTLATGQPLQLKSVFDFAETAGHLWPTPADRGRETHPDCRGIPRAQQTAPYKDRREGSEEGPSQNKKQGTVLENKWPFFRYQHFNLDGPSHL